MSIIILHFSTYLFIKYLLNYLLYCILHHSINFLFPIFFLDGIPESFSLNSLRTQHCSDYLPPIGTRGNLTFDISIASYTITPFFLILSILQYRCIIGWGNNRGTVPIILRRIPSYTTRPYRHPYLSDTYFFPSMGTACDHRFYERLYGAPFEGSIPTSRRSSRAIMPIYFTHPLQYCIYQLHTAPLLPQRRLSHPPGFNLVTYYIWDGRGSASPRPSYPFSSGTTAWWLWWRLIFQMRHTSITVWGKTPCAPRRWALRPC